jgi:hypothetical protein
MLEKWDRSPCSSAYGLALGVLCLWHNKGLDNVNAPAVKKPDTETCCGGVATTLS